MYLIVLQLRKEEFKSGLADVTVSHLSEKSLVALQGEPFSDAENRIIHCMLTMIDYNLADTLEYVTLVEIVVYPGILS